MDENSRISPFIWILGAIAFIICIGLAVWIAISFPNDLVNVSESEEVVVRVENGDIYIQEGTGKSAKFLDNLSINDVNGFSFVGLSPDKKHVCVIADAPATKWLYYARIENSLPVDITKVTVAQNCVWSNDSAMIAFINYTTDVSAHDVYVFFVNTKQHKNYTKDLSSTTKMRVYDLPTWSSDSTTVTSTYKEYDDKMAEKGSGTSDINVVTGKITDK